MGYSAALDRLMSLGGELHTRPGEPRRKFDLAHMRALLAALGNPEQRFPSVLIAGTNGKGSTAATLASILSAAGYTTGLYTSPHLSCVNERICISAGDGGSAAIKDAVLFEHLARVEAAAESLVAAGALPGPPSFFETMTATAMLAFAARSVDIAVLEVGMGGRLDATNVVEPLLSIITDISLDHTEWLGSTIAEIAREKAGILRQGGTMITLPQHPEANQALGEMAVALNVRGVNAAEYLPGRSSSFEPGSGSGWNRYELTGLPEIADAVLLVDSPLRGQHQQRNVALAIAAAISLRNTHSYKIERSHIERGIRETRWPGRLELLPAEPARPAVLLDVAHNPAGAWTLRAAVGQMGLEGPCALIFGCMRDKALDEMAQILFPIFDHIYLTALPSPRAASIAELVEAAGHTGASHTEFADPGAALDAAIQSAGAQPGSLIVACGSVVLIGALRSLLV